MPAVFHKYIKTSIFRTGTTILILQTQCSSYKLLSSSVRISIMQKMQIVIHLYNDDLASTSRKKVNKFEFSVFKFLMCVLRIKHCEIRSTVECQFVKPLRKK